MDWNQVLEWLGVVWAWIVAAQLPVIVGLIVVDVGLGIAVAVKAKYFEWKRVGEFYRSMVVPYVIAYLVVRAAVQVVPGLEGLVGEGLVAAAFGTITYNLIGSVASNVKALKLFSQVYQR
jgi:hypothetical protein